MSRKPSAETMLRQVKGENNVLRNSLKLSEHAAKTYRERATKAEQEAAEWKRRFDLLLSKTETVRASPPSEKEPT